MREFAYRAEQVLVSNALEALREKIEIPGVSTAGRKKIVTTQGPQTWITLTIDGSNHRYLVEAKLTVDRKAQLDHIAFRVQQLGSQCLLVTDCMSRELAAHCRQIGLQFIDTHGNAWLRSSGVFIFVVGEKRTGRASATIAKGIASSATLRVIFALLSKPELVSSSFKDIAKISGVAIGTAYNVLRDLEGRGYMLAGSKNNRRILESDRLFEEWGANFPTRLRSKLNSRRFSCPDPYWWKNINVSEINAVWGSEVAAAMMCAELKPITQTLYIDSHNVAKSISMLAKKIRMRADPEGSIEILEKFWSSDIETLEGLAPPLLVYSDLLSLLDPRVRKTALVVREQFINPLLPL